jgi:hypothetical protein
MTQTISIASDFSKFPAGRYRADGPASGERFREEFLLPALRRGPVIVVLDGVAGLPSSFFEEAIGGIIRSGFSYEDARRLLTFYAETPRMASYAEQGRRYLTEASKRLSGAR